MSLCCNTRTPSHSTSYMAGDRSWWEVYSRCVSETVSTHKHATVLVTVTAALEWPMSTTASLGAEPIHPTVATVWGTLTGSQIFAASSLAVVMVTAH